MSDLLTELRQIGCFANGDARCTCVIGMDAADEIAALRARAERAEAERDALREAAWVDTRHVEFDGTMLFGKGYDFDGWEHCRREFCGELGWIAVWPEWGLHGREWRYYGGPYGAFSAIPLPTEAEARRAAERVVSPSLAREGGK